MEPRRTVLLGALVALAVAAAGCSKLSALNTLMPADPGGVRVARDVAYGEAPRQRLDVYAPAGGAYDAPVVVFIYGGGWDSGSRHAYSFVGHALAANGFVTVIPDYRLVPEVRYPAFVADSAAVVRWVHANIGSYGGDPAGIGVAGHSAGAYNAVMLGVAPRYTKGADALPIQAVAGLSGPYDFLPLDARETRRAFSGVADLPATQPVTIATSAGPPLFLATGTADSTVEPRNTSALAAVVRPIGRSVRVERYAGADHADVLLAFGRWFRDKAPVLRDVTAFFRAHLGDNARTTAPR